MALPVFYPIVGGGPLRFLGDQKGLRARGVDVRVLTGTPRAKDELHQPGQSPSDTEARGRAWSAAKVGTMLPVEFVEGTPVHRVRLPARTGVLRTNAYFRALLDLCRDPETRPDVILSLIHI